MRVLSAYQLPGRYVGSSLHSALLLHCIVRGVFYCPVDGGVTASMHCVHSSTLVVAMHQNRSWQCTSIGRGNAPAPNTVRSPLLR